MNIALVIIDMQNDFVLPEAPLCVKGAQATVPTIQKLLDRARAEGWRVIHVIRQHRRDGSDVEIGRAPLFTQGSCSRKSSLRPIAPPFVSIWSSWFRWLRRRTVSSSTAILSA